MKRYYSFLVLLSITIQPLFADSVSLIVTTNVHGEVDPCGWPKKPLGGLARKATIIDELKEGGKDPIILDAGNLFFKKKALDPGIATESAKINTEIIVDAYNSIGCDAFSPGVNDFALGLDEILSLQGKAKFDFISSNLIYRDDPEKLIFKPYKIIKKNKKNVAVIGLTSIFLSDEISFLDPYEALINVINEVESISDFIVLLFDGKDEDLKSFYKNNLNINLIIKSNNSGIRSPDGGGKIPTYIIGNRGKVLYDFSINFKDDQLPFIDIAWCNNSISRLNSRLEKMKKGDLEVDLYELYKNDPTTLNRINNYNKQLNKAEDLLSNAINTITFEKIELNKNIFDKPSILKIIDKGKLKIKDLIGPEMLDSKGRLPTDPHYNHSH